MVYDVSKELTSFHVSIFYMYVDASMVRVILKQNNGLWRSLNTLQHKSVSGQKCLPKDSSGIMPLENSKFPCTAKYNNNCCTLDTFIDSRAETDFDWTNNICI